MENYTKVSDKLVAKYGIKVAYVYAKLSYRMRLSRRDKNHYFDDGFFEIYKIKDLMSDCHLGRNSIINILGKLEHAHLILRIHTRFVSKIYLPQFGNQKSGSSKQTSPSHESKLSEQPKSNNNNSNKCVPNCYSVKSVRDKSEKYPKLEEINQKYGSRLVKYAITIYEIIRDKDHRIYSPYHFIVGILRRWARKHIKTVNDAMISEHDPHADLCPNGPAIPIFKI